MIRSPLATLVIAGAETLDMLSTKLDAANLVTTATINSSIVFKLPWLSRAGTAIKILKLASGDNVIWSLFVGTIYGSPGVITTLFARIVSGGKLNTDQTLLFVKSVASVPRNVVIAAVTLTY